MTIKRRSKVDKNRSSVPVDRTNKTNKTNKTNTFFEDYARADIAQRGIFQAIHYSLRPVYSPSR